MDNMKEALAEVTGLLCFRLSGHRFQQQPQPDGTLDYTISNLKQNLSLGFLFICIVAILFLGDIKSPAVIGFKYGGES